MHDHTAKSSHAIIYEIDTEDFMVLITHIGNLRLMSVYG